MRFQGKTSEETTMTDEISPDILGTSGLVHLAGEGPSASIWARLTARLRADRFDAMLAVGAPIPVGSALAVHAARLTSRAERDAIAGSLRRAASDAHDSSATVSMRVPLNKANIARVEELIDTITLRLYSPRPVRSCGMARLRRVLSDGRGPLYQFGRGDLEGRLGAALAEL
jgi:hypothetical protein